MARLVPALGALLVAGVLSGAAGGTGAVALPHVTLIGDSVATAIPGDGQALRVLGRGVDLEVEVAPCRRLVQTSCAVNTPTAMDLIKQKGASLGPTVVLVIGYNEFADQWADAVDKTLDALERVGVDHVFWLTLKAAHHPYLAMNDQLEAAAAKHPKLTVIDWEVYARSHPDWFQADALHLLGPGSEAMATLIHKKLLLAGIAVPPVVVQTKALPAAHRGKAYTARLVGTTGRRPYVWSLSGRLPAGLHLRPSGVLWGVPRAPAGRFTFTVQAKDATGQLDTRKLVLLLR